MSDIEQYKEEILSDGSLADDERIMIQAKSYIFQTVDLMRVAFCDDPDKPFEFNPVEEIKSHLFRLRAVAKRFPLDRSMADIDKRIADADPWTPFWVALDARLEELSKYLPTDFLPIIDFNRYRPRIMHIYTSITEADDFVKTYVSKQRRESIFLHGIPNSLMLEEMKLWDAFISVASRYPRAIASRNLLEKLVILHLLRDIEYSLRTAISAEYASRLYVSKNSFTA